MNIYNSKKKYTNNYNSICTLLVLLTIAFLPINSVMGQPAPDSFSSLAEKLLPSVVNISTTQVIEGRAAPQMPQLPPGSPFEDFFKEFFDKQGPGNKSRRAQSLGSGFIIGDKGHIITNNHVIQDADEITVILHDDTRLIANLVGRDAKTDLAVLKINPNKNLKGVDFGDSSKSRVGDWVLAIGNPFGLGGTVTAGIISARGRNINAGPYDDFIQTDASINRGNSGGPMFNMEGQVIGINTAIFSPSGGSVGIGFAIPSSAAEPVITQLIEKGKVQRGWLGVHIQKVTKEIAENLGLDKAQGALVASLIPGGPAEASKIEPGDIILSFDGNPVSEMRNLPKIVADTPVNKPVDVIVWRNNNKKTLKATVGVLQEKIAKSSGIKSKPGVEKLKNLGLTVSSLSPPIRKQFKLEKNIKGIIVVNVDIEGPAAKKGIRPGDLITEIGQVKINTPKEALKQIKIAKNKGRKSVLLLINGETGSRFVALTFSKD